MVELLVASAFVGAGVVAIARRSSTAADGFGREELRTSFEVDAADLPCPWCQAATRETDRRCPSCGQRFG
jgi:hypothetical protein